MMKPVAKKYAKQNNNHSAMGMSGVNWDEDHENDRGN